MTTTAPKKISATHAYKQGIDQKEQLLKIQNDFLNTPSPILFKPKTASDGTHQLKKADTQAPPKPSEETATISDMKRWVQITPNGSPNPSRHGG
ncbi:MAG: hypothetical protein SFZ02_15305 [bacterium]|nr:hypothetical protein [bacterium]